MLLKDDEVMQLLTVPAAAFEQLTIHLLLPPQLALTTQHLTIKFK